jgi:zinc D-Ala-D-Ala carboxypeptidase
MSKYFKEIEYNMDLDFLAKLDKAREYAEIPFVINSAYRSPEHPESIKNPTSSHIKGLAVDIRTTDSRTRYKVLNALIHVGFNRIGIADTFIHVDDDKEKSCGVIWTY